MFGTIAGSGVPTWPSSQWLSYPPHDESRLDRGMFETAFDVGLTATPPRSEVKFYIIAGGPPRCRRANLESASSSDRRARLQRLRPSGAWFQCRASSAPIISTWKLNIWSNSAVLRNSSSCPQPAARFSLRLSMRPSHVSGRRTRVSTAKMGRP